MVAGHGIGTVVKERFPRQDAGLFVGGPGPWCRQRIGAAQDLGFCGLAQELLGRGIPERHVVLFVDEHDGHRARPDDRIEEP